MFTALSSSLLIFSGVLLQVSPELQTALESIAEKRAPVVTSQLGREAARVLAGPDRPREAARVEALIRVAVKGRASRPLAAALLTIVATERGESVPVAARALAGMDVKLRLRVLRAPPKGLTARLKRLVRSDDGPTARAGALLLAPTATPELLRSLLQTWIRDEHEDRAVVLLSQAAHFQAPQATFTAIVGLQFEGYDAEHAHGEAITTLAERSEVVAVEVLRRARMGSSSAAIRGLTALYDRRQVTEARQTVADLVDPDGLEDERIVAAALHVGATLFVTDMLDPARELALGRKVPVRIRRAAIDAFARLAYKDATTIRLLIRLLKDPVVAQAAHRALEFKTGAKLRGQAEVWSRWLLGAKLTAGPPEDLEERHQESLDLRLRFGAKRVQVQRRAEARLARLRVKEGELELSSLRAYEDFVAAHATLDRAAFLERVRVPHLFLRDLTALLETAEFRTLRAREADTPVALSTRPGWPDELGRAGVCPVQKAGNAIGTRVSVGRSAICDIPLTDGRVSKSHAYFSWADGCWSLTDAGSTNGTTLDGLDLTANVAHPLQAGARIRFADLVEVVFLEPEGLWELLLDAVALIGDQHG